MSLPNNGIVAVRQLLTMSVPWFKHVLKQYMIALWSLIRLSGLKTKRGSFVQKRVRSKSKHTGSRWRTLFSSSTYHLTFLSWSLRVVSLLVAFSLSTSFESVVYALRLIFSLWIATLSSNTIRRHSSMTTNCERLDSLLHGFEKNA